MKRRNFLKTSVAFITPTIISGNPIHIFDNNHPILNPQVLANVNNDKVLVIIQLSGGNDGLNTVIPKSVYSNYYNARTNIAIPETSILKLNNFDATGLHPSMTGMQNLFNDGKLSIIQSVGYPEPNYSHFRATDIWMSASDSDQYLNTGWAGRYLDFNYPNYPDDYPNAQTPDPLAIQIGSITSLTCQGPVVNMGLSISNPSSTYNLLDGVDEFVPNTNGGYELNFIRTIAKQTNKYATRLKQVSDSITQQGTYPANNSLASQLKIVARLIKGGLGTKIYLVSTGGFDTHSNQVQAGDTIKGTHANLLSGLSEAIKSFQDDLKGLEVEDRVLGMTFSEFGRRVKSNASGGTDHGAAAPLFLFGKNLRGGVFGTNPNLPLNATVNDNIPYQYDFRSIYNSIIQNWFCVSETDALQVMYKQFPILPIINASACSVVGIETPASGKPGSMINCYPNPFKTSTQIEFKVSVGHTLLQLLNNSGTVIRVLVDGMFNYEGNNSYSLYDNSLSPGVYYIRLQHGIEQYVKSIIKL